MAASCPDSTPNTATATVPAAHATAISRPSRSSSASANNNSRAPNRKLVNGIGNDSNRPSSTSSSPVTALANRWSSIALARGRTTRSSRVSQGASRLRKRTID